MVCFCHSRSEGLTAFNSLTDFVSSVAKWDWSCNCLMVISGAEAGLRNRSSTSALQSLTLSELAEVSGLELHPLITFNWVPEVFFGFKSFFNFSEIAGTAEDGAAKILEGCFDLSLDYKENKM